MFPSSKERSILLCRPLVFVQFFLTLIGAQALIMSSPFLLGDSFIIIISLMAKFELFEPRFRGEDSGRSNSTFFIRARVNFHGSF